MTTVGEYSLSNTDRLNVLDLASQSIDAQEDTDMQRLHLANLSSKSVLEPNEEDLRLTNALASSTITHLADLELSRSTAYFRQGETRSNLLGFIQN